MTKTRAVPNLCSATERQRLRWRRGMTEIWVALRMTRIAVALPNAKLLRDFFDHFEIDGDVDIVADDHAAAVNAGVPLHAVVLAIYFGGRADGYAGVAPRIFYGGAGAFDVENRFLGDAVNGQVAGDFQFADGNLFHFFGLESNGGIFFYVKKLVAFEVLVAIGFIGINGFCVDGNVHGGLGDVLIIPDDGSDDALEFATNGGNHQVLYGKACRGVRRIDLPGGGGCRRGKRERRREGRAKSDFGK